MKHILITVYLLLFVSFIGLNSSVCAYTGVSAGEAKNLVESNKGLIILDVRESGEFCDENGYISGAVNYPWISGVLQEKYDELPLNSEILVVCRSGNRSNAAAEFLDSKGYLSVYNMAGGMLSWQWNTEVCSFLCPSEVLLRSDKDSINTLRLLRDEVFMKNDLGLLLTTLYYFHAKEVSVLFFINSDLKEKTVKVLTQLVSEIEPLLDGKSTVMERQTFYTIEILLDEFAQQASPELKATIRQIKNGITKGAILDHFNITVSE